MLKLYLNAVSVDKME